MMRRAIVAAAVILMLSATSIVGVVAQDESPLPDEMPTRTVPVDVVLLEALCEANAPDEAAKTNCLAVVHDILAAEQGPTDEVDLALVQEYSAAVDAYLAAFDEANKISKMKRQVKVIAKAADELIETVEVLEFPSAAQVVADELIAASRQQAVLLRKWADKPSQGLTGKQAGKYFSSMMTALGSIEPMVVLTLELDSLLGLPQREYP